MADVMERMAAQMSALQRQMETGAARVLELQATVQSQQSTIDRMQSQQASSSGEAAPLARVDEALTKAVSKMGDGNSSGNKDIGKPFTFKCDEASFNTWCKKLKNYVGSEVRGSRVLMDWASEQTAPISDEQVRLQFPDQADDLEKIKERVFFHLNTFTDGEAFVLVSNPPGRGLECFRKLCHRFDPQTAGRLTNVVTTLTNPPKVKMEDLASAIEIWEEQLRIFESRRGPDGQCQTFQEFIKVGALVQMCPNDIMQALIMNASQLGGSYNAHRQHIMQTLETKLGMRMRPPPANSRDPSAMYISSMPPKAKTCDNCGKQGHFKAACWAPGGGAHRPGGKGNWRGEGGELSSPVPHWSPFPSGGKGKGKGKGGKGKGDRKGGKGKGKGKGGHHNGGKGKGKGGKGKGKGKGKGHYHYDATAGADYYWIGEDGTDWSSYYEGDCLLYTSPSPRDQRGSRMPSSA